MIHLRSYAKCTCISSLRIWRELLYADLHDTVIDTTLDKYNHLDTYSSEVVYIRLIRPFASLNFFVAALKSAESNLL